MEGLPAIDTITLVSIKTFSHSRARPWPSLLTEATSVQFSLLLSHSISRPGPCLLLLPSIMKFTANRLSFAPVILGIGALNLFSFVRADFAQCMSGWEWVRSSLSISMLRNSLLSRLQSYNSEGSNPCEIAGSLQAPCLGYCASVISPSNKIDHSSKSQTAVYVLGPLADGTNYITPQQNDTTAQNCGCNTVIYSLYAACSACQFNSSYTPVT